MGARVAGVEVLWPGCRAWFSFVVWRGMSRVAGGSPAMPGVWQGKAPKRGRAALLLCVVLAFLRPGAGKCAGVPLRVSYADEV